MLSTTVPAARADIAGKRQTSKAKTALQVFLVMASPYVSLFKIICASGDRLSKVRLSIMDLVKVFRLSINGECHQIVMLPRETAGKLFQHGRRAMFRRGQARRFGITAR